MFIGLGTGFTMIVEEVRLDWLAPSTSTSDYVPPVGRFYVQHYRDLAVTTDYSSTYTPHTAYTVQYEKKSSSSSLRFYFSMTRAMHFKDVDADAMASTSYYMNILIDDSPCSDPHAMLFTEHSNMRRSLLVDAMVLTGVCNGSPAGPLTITIGTTHKAESADVEIMIGSHHQPRLIIQEVQNGILDYV